MKIKILVISLIFAGILFAQDHKHNNGQKHQDKELREIISMISSNFEKLERDYLTKLSYRDYTKAKSILIDTYDLLNSIDIPEEHQDDLPLPISDADFNGLLESVKSEGFDSDKLSVISIAAAYHYFLVEQALQLMDLFIISDSKIEVVKMIYPNVLDKNNSHRLVSAFTFSSDKDEIKKIINTYQDR